MKSSSGRKDLGVGDIAQILRKLDDLRKQGSFSMREYLKIKETLLAKI